MYRNQKGRQKRTPMMLQNIVNQEKEKGVLINTYGDVSQVFVNFSSFGGTDTNINGVVGVVDTAQIITWFRPDIKSNSRFQHLITGAVYEVMGEPENIEDANFELQIKLRRVKGL